MLPGMRTKRKTSAQPMVRKHSSDPPLAHNAHTTGRMAEQEVDIKAGRPALSLPYIYTKVTHHEQTQAAAQESTGSPPAPSPEKTAAPTAVARPEPLNLGDDCRESARCSAQVELSTRYA